MRLSIMFIRLMLAAFLMWLPTRVQGQSVAEHIDNQAIYEFLDEMAGLQFIRLNSAIKPYSREMILEKLEEVRLASFAEKGGKPGQRLNRRQLAELSFFLKEYRLERGTAARLPGDFDLYRKDSSFCLSLVPTGLFFSGQARGSTNCQLAVRPIAGLRYLHNENGSFTHRWQGAEAYAYLGKGWRFQVNFRDNYHSRPMLADSFFTLERGQLYTGENLQTDFMELRAGISYTWAWGCLSLQKEDLQWGDNAHGANILSAHPPSFPVLSLQLKPLPWLEFNYFHGWLSSLVVDSNRTYPQQNGDRVIYRDKYIAANMLTAAPWKYLLVSIGNSVIYSDIAIQPLYLIPFMVFKAVDNSAFANSNMAGQNSQLFFNISSRDIRHLHLYTSFFIDEVAFGRFWDKAAHTNFISGKLGARLSNFPLKNLSLGAEYTRTNPMVYQHFISTLSFASNGFCLGHYLRDNSDEIYLSLQYKPSRGVQAGLSFTRARHGNDYVYGQDPAQGKPFMETVSWEAETWKAGIRWEVISRCSIYLNYSLMTTKGNVKKFTPGFYQGETNTLETGLSIGI